MFLFYVLSVFNLGDTFQGRLLFKKGHYLRKYGMYFLSILGKILSLLDLKPQVPHDSLQLKYIKLGFSEQCPNFDQLSQFS